jgi:hypothetical protein
MSEGFPASYIHCTHGAYRNKQVGDFPLIPFPCLTVLSPAPFNISLSAVNDHDHEKKEIKPRKWTPVRQQLAITAGSLEKQKVPKTGD